MIDAATARAVADDPRDAEIAGLYSAGRPLSHIAAALGMTVTDVFDRVRAKSMARAPMAQRPPAETPSPSMAHRPREQSAAPAGRPSGSELRARAVAFAHAAKADPSVVANPQRDARTPPTPGGGRPGPAIGQPEERPEPSTRRRVAKKMVDPAERRAVALAALEADEGDLDDRDLSDLPGRPRGWLVTEAQHEAAFARSGGRFVDVVLRRRT